jgi:hypothetical protein
MIVHPVIVHPARNWRAIGGRFESHFDSHETGANDFLIYG